MANPRKKEKKKPKKKKRKKDNYRKARLFSMSRPSEASREAVPPEAAALTCVKKSRAMIILSFFLFVILICKNLLRASI
jgi:hypothetical protein